MPRLSDILEGQSFNYKTVYSEAYFQANQAQVIAQANVYQKLSGTYQNVKITNFFLNAEGKLEYNSDVDMDLKVVVKLQVSSPTPNTTVKCAVEMNGSVVDGDRAGIVFCARSGETFYTSFDYIKTFTKGDKLDFVITADGVLTITAVTFYTSITRA